jgi:thiamine-monophosphate kinase
VTGEFAAIDAIRARLPPPPSDDQVWIGDDAAVLPAQGGGVLLLAVDTVVSGVHADLALTGLDDFGWKAVAASVSDIAAMGGDTGHALVSVAGPPGTDLEMLYRGIREAAEAFDCPVVGGDLTNAGDLVVTVAVSGTCPCPPVLRSGASAGDHVWVTGPLGSSAAGLRRRREGRDSSDVLVSAHARPVPRLAEGRAARIAGATAMIDVSDGLAADLGHIVEASGVGVELSGVPVASGGALDEALHGGEDFELVFCAPPSADIIGGFAGLRTPVRIGVCTRAPGVMRLDGEVLEPAGWEHRW